MTEAQVDKVLNNLTAAGKMLDMIDERIADLGDQLLKLLCTSIEVRDSLELGLAAADRMKARWNR